MSIFHVTFKERKLIIEVDNSARLEEKVKREFCIQEDIKFQLFNKEWDDWVDTEAANLPPKGKLKIVPINPESQLPLENYMDRSSPSSSLTSLFDSESLTYNLNEAGPSRAQSEISPPSQTTVTHLVEESNSSTKEVRERRKLDEVHEWPNNFSLPRLPLVLESKLKANKMPSDRERRQIIQTLFDYMASFTCYPSSAHYSEAVRCLLEEFPLLGKETIPGARPVEYWRLKLMDKFRNERKHLPPEKRRKRCGETSSAEVECEVEVPVDDPASIQRHKLWLQEEAKRSKQNMTKISHLMDITFQSRRKWIIDEKPTMGDLKREFPCLFSQKQVLQEMSRITPAFDSTKPKALLLTNLEPYSTYLIDKSPSKKPDVKAMFCRYQEVLQTLTSDQAKEAKVLTSLILVPSYFRGETLSAYLVGDQDQGSLLTSHPKVCFKGDVYAPCDIVIQAENVLVCTCTSLLDALSSLICTYYAFHIEYPKECKNSLLLVETMLGLNTKTTRSVQSLIQRVLSGSSKT